MTDAERRTVLAVFGEVLALGNKAHSFIGSETLKDMAEMYVRLECEPYCKEHGVRFEDLDEYDFEQMYRDKYEW